MPIRFSNTPQLSYGRQTTNPWSRFPAHAQTITSAPQLGSQPVKIFNPKGEARWALRNDPRVTRAGGVLRRTRVDELPQLWNVLRGEMSLVGPRPCLAYETEHFAAHHFERFLVPAGVTGLWQVSARANATFGEALDMDVAYARGWSSSICA